MKKNYCYIDFEIEIVRDLRMIDYIYNYFLLFRINFIVFSFT